MNVLLVFAVVIFTISVIAAIPSAIAIYRYYFGGGKLLHDRLPRHLDRR